MISQLSQVHAAHVTAYRLVNAVAATVSQGEIRQGHRCAGGSITLSNKRSKHFTDQSGFPNNYGLVQLSVRKHQNRLDASIAFPGKVADGFNGAVRLILIDPRGALAANSIPQGLSNYGSADVINPVAGRWTAVIFDLEAGKTLDGTTGKVLFEASTQEFASFAVVSPRTLTIPAGGTGRFGVTVGTPSHPGDADGAVVLNSGHGARPPSR